MTKWITAHLKDYGEGGTSLKGKEYRTYSINVVQKNIKTPARLILMSHALEYWETRFSVYWRPNKLTPAGDTILMFTPAFRKWSSLGRGIEVPVFFIFNRFHIKQFQQRSLDKHMFFTETQKEMRLLVEIMIGRKE